MCNKRRERHKFQKGYTPWNKGLTKKIDKRLVRTTEYINSVTGKGIGTKLTEQELINKITDFYKQGYFYIPEVINEQRRT